VREIKFTEVSELLNSDPEPETWYVHKVIPQKSFVMLTSYPKGGKTTLVYPMLMAIASGEPFAGLDTVHAPILLLAVEEHREMVKRRLLKFKDGQKIEDLYVWTGNYPWDKSLDGQKALEAFIAEKGIKILVIDTLARLVLFEDESDGSEVTIKMDPFLKLRDKYDMTIIVLHHSRKNMYEETDAIKSARGSGALVANPDLVISLEKYNKSETPNSRRLSFQGRYDESFDYLILDFDKVENRFNVSKEARSIAKDQMRETIFKLIPKEGITKDELVMKLQMSDKMIRIYLSELLEDKKIKNTEARKGIPSVYSRL
jgi:hypothetical protein